MNNSFRARISSLGRSDRYVASYLNGVLDNDGDDGDGGWGWGGFHFQVTHYVLTFQ